MSFYPPAPGPGGQHPSYPSHGQPYPPITVQPYPSYARSPPAPGRLVTEVELHISCESLLQKDVMSKSDPIGMLQIHDAKSGKWYEVGDMLLITTV